MPDSARSVTPQPILTTPNIAIVQLHDTAAIFEPVLFFLLQSSSFVLSGHNAESDDFADRRAYSFGKEYLEGAVEFYSKYVNSY